MKYLGIHKLLTIMLLLMYLLAEIIIVSLWYISYIIWNLKFPQENLWFRYHNYIDDWDWNVIEDYSPKGTFMRRYKFIFSE